MKRRLNEHFARTSKKNLWLKLEANKSLEWTIKTLLLRKFDQGKFIAWRRLLEVFSNSVLQTLSIIGSKRLIPQLWEFKTCKNNQSWLIQKISKKINQHCFSAKFTIYNYVQTILYNFPLKFHICAVENQYPMVH